MEKFALTLHQYGGRHTFFIFSLAVVLFLIWFSEFEAALIFLLAFTATMGSTLVLKVMFRVPRPMGSDLEKGSYAFPSAHAAGVFFLAITLGNIAGTWISSLWLTAILALLSIVAISIAVSRIVLNVHTTLQVVVGATIGFFVPLIIILNQNTILSLIFSLIS
jgi:membrane-associated phospholipid phosphatase